jgi:hypothetical protein
VIFVATKKGRTTNPPPLLLLLLLDPGWIKIRIRDPGSGINIRDPGSGINIPDPQHWTDRWKHTVNLKRECHEIIAYFVRLLDPNLVPHAVVVIHTFKLICRVMKTESYTLQYGKFF